MLFVYNIYKLRKFLDNNHVKNKKKYSFLKQKLKIYSNKCEINYRSTSK